MANYHSPTRPWTNRPGSGEAAPTPSSTCVSCWSPAARSRTGTSTPPGSTRTLAALLDDAHPHDAGVLRRYARFRVLPGVRRRLASGGVTVGVCHAATNTLRITCRFLRWLREHNADLQHLPQAVLDQWSTEHPGNVADLAVFLRWAARNNLTGTATVNDRRRWGPTAFLPTEQHWQLANRFLNDDDLPAAHRLLGCLVLLYGQPVRRLATLRRSDVTVTNSTTTIKLGGEAVVLPEPLARVTADLAAGRIHDANVAGLAQSFPRTDDWLFPGRRAGLPIGDKGLHRRLTKLGVPPRRARNTALVELTPRGPARDPGRPARARPRDRRQVAPARRRQLDQLRRDRTATEPGRRRPRVRPAERVTAQSEDARCRVPQVPVRESRPDGLIGQPGSRSRLRPRGRLWPAS